MNKYSIEIKWGVIFMLLSLLWMVFERVMGWHDVHIDKHALYTNIFAIPAVLVYILALRQKKQACYAGKMSWLEGFLCGLGITIVVMILAPLSQFVILNYITPHYFTHAIDYAVQQGYSTPEEAAAYFSMKSYIIQSVLGALMMGVVTSAIVAFFMRTKRVAK